MNPTPLSLPDRRELLAGAGALGLGALLPSGAAASPASPAAARAVLQGVCPLTLEQIQGPFYLDLDLVRRDITEMKPGLPVTLIFLVVQAGTCEPIPGAMVDVWQADALGLYSGVPALGTAGQTFLRGIQPTDANGVASFETIYPGWYPARTTHVHVKVRPDATHEATTQLYLPDPLTALVYQTFSPYDQKGAKDTPNPADAFYHPALQMAWRVAPGGPLGLWAGIVLSV